MTAALNGSIQFQVGNQITEFKERPVSVLPLEKLSNPNNKNDLPFVKI
jgi:hypothetical protein